MSYIENTTGGGGAGTVTSVGTAGIATGGPITTSGTITVAGSGNTTTAATAAANLAAAPNGDVVVTDGSGNVKDSGVLLSSLGTGTVTSVALAADSGAILTVTGSPITTSGTLHLQFSNESANAVLAGPTSGGAATPAFRALVAADLPVGTGTVTSFSSGNVDSIATTSVATATTTPALSFTLSTQTANFVWAGPTTGPAAAPTFRALVAADLPGGTGTVTSVSFTGGLISVATPTTTPALTVAGTSGGIPYFSSATTWATSAALASGGVVLGGGAGTAPSTNTHLTFATNTLTVGLAGTGSGILALAGSTSGSATITAPATAGTSTNPITISNSLQLPSGTVYNWNADTGLSRDSAGVIDVGNGTAADKSGSINLTGITMTGVLTNSLSPAVSQSAVTLSGAPQTGGSGTTNFPLLYLNTTGASAPTTFSTAGTFFGINAASGFVGVFLDLRVNGTQNFSVSSAGNIVTQGTLAVTGATQLTGTVSGTGITSLFASPPAIGGTSASTGAFTSLTATSVTTTSSSIISGAAVAAATAGKLRWTSSSSMLAPSDGVIELTNSAGTSFTRLDFGGTTASFPALQISGTTVTIGLADGTTTGGSLGLGGTVTKYNNIATVRNGVASEYASSDLTAQSAAITATTLYATTATAAYRVSWSAAITTAATVSSVLGGTNGFQVLYTSPTDSVVKTTVSGASVTSAANTTGTATSGSLIVYAKTGTNIQYTYDYTSSGVTAMVYELHISVEQL